VEDSSACDGFYVISVRIFGEDRPRVTRICGVIVIALANLAGRAG